MIFDELKDEYELEVPHAGRIKLIKGKQRPGILNLKNHRWCVYSIITDNDFPFHYTHLIFVPQKVTENMRERVKNKVIKDGKGVAKYAPMPHIDGDTGNIHSEEYNFESLEGKEVCQLVCCYDGHSGPNITKHYDKTPDDEKDYYRYRENFNSEGGINVICEGKEFYVPKAAYYPNYDENGQELKTIKYDDEDNKKLYEIMKTIWNVVCQ